MGYGIQAKMRSIVTAWILLLMPVMAMSQYDMYWTDESKNAYHLLSNLRIEEAMAIIKLQGITFPDNLIWPYLEDYGLFLSIFIHEDSGKTDAFLESSAKRLERLSVVSESNPLALMSQAQLYLHQSALRLQKGEFASAAADVNRAFRLLKKNQRLHPDDLPNLRLFAALKAAYGAIPDQYRWLVSIVSSLSGSIDEGLAELHHILEESTPLNNIYYTETILITALAEGKLNNKPEKGAEMMNRYFGKIPQNRLIQYVMANLEMMLGDMEAAIRVLSINAGTPGAEKIPFLHYMLGKCKLFRGDDDAQQHIRNFLVLTKGQHYIKDAYQKLAWHSLLRNDRSGYLDYMQQVLIKGSADTDEDRQAMREAEKREIPHPDLLRCRMLFDGGYYERAGQILTEDLYNSLVHRAHRLEYLYRKGRVLHALKSYAEALHYYTLTITAGENEPYHFSCSAAYHCGLIHETLGSEGAAQRYYLICLQINPEVYATSIHQKARTALSRME